MNPNSKWNQMKILSLLLLFSFVFCLIPNGNAFADSSYRYQAYPQGTLGLTRPVIGFTFVTADFKISQNDSFQLLLDKTPVNGTFDEQKMTYSYTPSTDLKPGVHTVDFFFGISGYQTMSKSWTFTVSEQAVNQFPSSLTSEQTQGIAAINDYRKLFGLQPLQWSKELTQSAKSHASYLLSNQVDGWKVSLHDETNSNSGFTGADPMQRANYANYHQGGIGEDVSFGSNSLTEAIDSLFDAPYHRIPFLMQEASEIGIDREGKYVVIEFGMEKDAPTQMIVSPVPGDRYVPVNFNGHESPDPLQIHSGEASYPVGYPLLAVVTGQKIEKLMLDEATLTDSNGNPVQFLQDTPNSDKELNSSVMLIPKKPLLPDTRYSAHIKVSFTENGQAKTLEKSWNFQTEPTATVGKQKLHSNSDAYLEQTKLSDKISHVVTFGLQEKQYTLDGVTLPAKMQPIVIDGSSYLWVRDLANALGASVTWDDAQKAAVYSKQGKTITFYTTRNSYASGDGVHDTDTPAKLYNETTLIPVRLMSEVLGAKVDFDDAAKVIKITY